MTILFSIILLMQAASATGPAEYVVGPQDVLSEFGTTLLR